MVKLWSDVMFPKGALRVSCEKLMVSMESKQECALGEFKSLDLEDEHLSDTNIRARG
jgi:hypothetical protein